MILEMAHKLITSQLFSTVEDTIKASREIPDKEVYLSFDRYKATHSCIVLLKIRTRIRQTRVNMIHCTTSCCNGSL
jgi:hypothetical protein